MKKVVLAYSGGLDTCFCAAFLKEKGYQVIALTVDTGGFSLADICNIKKKARNLAVYKHYFIDGKESLYEKIIAYIIKGNILRGQVYPLCVAPERIIQAIKLVKIAKEEQAEAVAHGSTGAGNDQVRFDVVVKTLAPELKIITPIRDTGITRAAEIAYLKKHGIAVEKISQSYSINKGMLGTTIGGGKTKGSWGLPPDSAYPTVIPIEKVLAKKQELIISFTKGLPTQLDGKPISGVKIMNFLNLLGAKHGVGKDSHLGDTILGIKGRVAFEAPAAFILIKAHRELEKLVLTHWQLFWKNHLADVYGNFLHEALYFDPLMRDIETFIDSSQQVVTGDARVILHRGNIIVGGVKSPYSLMDKTIATYGEKNLLWTGKDAASFCQLFGMQGILAKKARLIGETYEKNKTD